MGSVQKHASVFATTKPFPKDGIFEVARRFQEDTFPQKVNLGRGAYSDEQGQPWVLPSVRMAEKIIADAQPNHEYEPIAGHPPFRKAAADLVFHGTKALAEGRIATVQSISGTGALLLVGLALKQADTGIKTIYLTSPTWPNHDVLFGQLGFELRTLPYYKDNAFDFPGFLAALKETGPGAAVVFHTCAHNPTGCDPSREQWRAIAEVVAQTGVFPVLDSAYLGFNSGSVDDDAWPIRHFVEERGLEAAVCLSFAKNMGLYGERTGLVAFVTPTAELADVVDSVLENAQRSTVSTSPAYGARIAAAILTTPALREQWAKDLVTMSTRIRSMRQKVLDELVRLGTPGDWSFLTKQSGMFGYLGITPEQVQYLEEKHHVYLTSNSRISVAGLNSGNVAYFAQSLDDTVRWAAK